MSDKITDVSLFNKISIQTCFYAEVTEYEAGWGCRPDGYYISNDEHLFKNYIEEYNNSNNSPEWSMTIGSISVGIVKDKLLESCKDKDGSFVISVGRNIRDYVDPFTAESIKALLK